MKKVIGLSLCILGLCNFQTAMSQVSSLFKTGTIEYERTQNIMATFNYDPQLQGYVDKTGSEIYSSFFTLTILPEKSLYQFNNHNGKFNQFPEMPADINKVYYDFTNGKKIVQKIVNGQIYSIIGETKTIEWKLTDERRTIAGYDCRRANALIFDSVYVVAFFSDKFIPQIGPESFGGLPGLIMGISIPGEHISWFATKVIPMETPPKIDAPVGAQEISLSNYQIMLEHKVLTIPKFGLTMYKRALL
jgi:GLPGLI family protein